MGIDVVAGVVTLAADTVRFFNGDREVHLLTLVLDLVALVPGGLSLGLGRIVKGIAEDAETLEKLGTFLSILVRFGDGQVSIEALLIDFGKIAEDLKSVVTTGRWAVSGLDITSGGLAWAPTSAPDADRVAIDDRRRVGAPDASGREVDGSLGAVRRLRLGPRPGRG
jgi:hypothetical protein